MATKKYGVTATVVGGKWIGEYEAANAEEAIRLALADDRMGIQLCHYCSSHVEDPMITKLVACRQDENGEWEEHEENLE